MLVGEARRHRTTALARGTLALVTTLVTIVSIGDGSADAAGFDCSGGPAYTVRPGDGWFSIAGRIGVTADDLLAANDADLDDVLLAGDELCLPAGADLAAACARPRMVRSGDSWHAIARSAGVTTTTLLDANGATASTPLHPDQIVCLPPGADSTGTTPTGGTSGGGGSYVVRDGDSWYDIARRASVGVRALLDANGADAADVIHPGTTVALPAGATTPTSSTTGSGGGSAGWMSLDALPMQGPCWYGDTWGDGRGGGRRHLGTDMFAAPGSYVYAVIDGTLSGRRWAGSGSISGNAWTLTGDDGTRVFYAHLFDFNPALRTGSRVEAGEIIGWVGGTGNASADHLHIEFRPGGGSPINPYPVLSAAGGCRNGTPYTQPSGWVPD